MLCYRLNSDKVGKASLGLAEAVDPKPQKKRGNNDACRQARQIYWTLFIQNGPAKDKVVVPPARPQRLKTACQPSTSRCFD